MEDDESVEVGLQIVNGGIQGGEEDEEGEEALSSDLEIEKALEWLDLKDGGEAVDGAFCAPWSSTLQSLSNRSQKLSSHSQAFTMEGWEGRMKVPYPAQGQLQFGKVYGEMPFDKLRSNEKADRAIVEQAIDQRTRMVLMRMLNHQVEFSTSLL